MLRLIVLMLVLLNGVYFSWWQGWLLPYGFGPVQQSEPQRLAQQIRPEAIQLISDKEALSASSPSPAGAPRAALCLQAGLLDERQANAVRGALQTALPDGAWTLEVVTAPERWIIYMGKYANAAEMSKKRAQLSGLGLTFEPLSNLALAPGLSLGGYASQEAANAALQALTLRGVRTARVVQETAASPAYLLRLPQLDEAAQKQLAPVRAALAGKPLEPCRPARSP